MADLTDRVSFLSLPAELRNHIYDLVGIVHDTRICISAPSTSHRPQTLPQAQVKEPTIALVSRQIRSEVLGTFYGQNMFSCNSRENIKSFLQRLPHSGLSAPRRIEWYHSDHAALSRTRTFLTRDMKPFLSSGLGADVVAASVQVKDEGRIYVTASEITQLKQYGQGLSRSAIVRVKRRKGGHRG